MAGEIVMYQENAGSWIRRTLTAGAKLLKCGNPAVAMDIIAVQAYNNALQALSSTGGAVNVEFPVVGGEVGPVTWNAGSKKLVLGAVGVFKVDVLLEGYASGGTITAISAVLNHLAGGTTIIATHSRGVVSVGSGAYYNIAMSAIVTTTDVTDALEVQLDSVGAGATFNLVDDGPAGTGSCRMIVTRFS